MKILQLTDIHLTSPGKTILGRDPILNFELALNDAFKNHNDIEALIISGDLSDWGEKADYEFLKEKISKLTVPTYLCIGNHDDREIFSKIFPNFVNDEGFVQYHKSFSEGNGIFLDTWGPETHAGFFCKKRADWLDKTLSNLENQCFIFMHHNPIPTYIIPTDKIMLLDTTYLEQVLRKYKEKVKHIFFGHCHMPLSGSFCGIPISAPRGTNHAGYPNFSEKYLLSASYLPESYSVIIYNEPSVTVHMVEFGYKGDIIVEGSPDYASWDKGTMKR